ncbi:MAG: hypothetical protein ACI9OU_000742 [Candidatus Promineifilaceae bacterium]|jgi:hypothetical protein
MAVVMENRRRCGWRRRGVVPDACGINLELRGDLEVLFDPVQLQGWSGNGSLAFWFSCPLVGRGQTRRCPSGAFNQLLGAEPPIQLVSLDPYGAPRDGSITLKCPARGKYQIELMVSLGALACRATVYMQATRVRPPPPSQHGNVENVFEGVNA